MWWKSKTLLRVLGLIRPQHQQSPILLPENNNTLSDASSIRLYSSRKRSWYEKKTVNPRFAEVSNDAEESRLNEEAAAAAASATAAATTAFREKRKMKMQEKANQLAKKLLDAEEDSKETIYGIMDLWVAWEERFPMAALKKTVGILRHKEEWHRIVQLHKWMLSKGQGRTYRTYRDLIIALEKDNRMEEAHTIWQTKIGKNLHSVSWNFCEIMIELYDRHNMPQRLIRLFRNIEMFNRKPRNMEVLQKVAKAYKMLGLDEEAENMLTKYAYVAHQKSALSTSESESESN